MALHLNLYHEIHRQAERERRDPVKLASLAGLFFLVFLAIWYSYRLSVVVRVESECNRLRNSWSTLEPQGKSAMENEIHLLAQQKSNQALIERIHQRFYWAPLLGEVAATIPAHIQITSLVGDMDEGKEKQTRTITLLVRGVAAGVQPRTAAEDFRRALREQLAAVHDNVTVGFDANSLEDGNETVTLNGHTLATAAFRIRAQFNPKAAQ